MGQDYGDMGGEFQVDRNLSGEKEDIICSHVTNYVAYGARRFNVSFTRALQ